jgi:hypothetical protein
MLRLGWSQTTGSIEVGNGTTRGLVSGGGINIGNASTNNFPINIGNCALATCQTNIGNLNVTTALLSPKLDANAVPLVIGQGLSSETTLGIAAKKLSIFGAATSQIDLLGGGIKCGTLASNFIDCNSAGGTLSIGGTNCASVQFSDSIQACTFTGSITKGAPTIMTAGSALPTLPSQIGYCGLTKNGTAGFVSYNFTSGPLAASRNYWVYGTTQLVVGGTYFVTMYLNFSTVTTFVRALLVNGATNVNDGIVNQTTWSTIGALNMAGSAIVSYPTGLVSGAEVINSTYYQCTSANSYIGLSVCVCNGTAPTIAGNYSIGYMRIA